MPLQSESLAAGRLDSGLPGDPAANGRHGRGKGAGVERCSSLASHVLKELYTPFPLVLQEPYRPMNSVRLFNLEGEERRRELIGGSWPGAAPGKNLPKPRKGVILGVRLTVPPNWADNLLCLE